MRRSLRSLGFVIAAAFRADPWRAAVMCALAPTSGLVTASSALWLKLLADAVTDRRSRVALLAAVALGAATGLTSVLRLMSGKLVFRLQQQIGLLLERQLVELAASLPGLEHHERPEYLDRLEHLRAERSTLGQALGAVVSSCSVTIQALATAALLASVHPVLLLLPVLGLPSLLTTAKSAAIIDGAKHATAPQTRLTSHYLAVATTTGPAKELRLFGLGEEVLRRHRALAETTMRARVRARLASVAWMAGGSLTFIAAYVGAIAFVVWRATLGLATPGDVLLTLQQAGQVNSNILGIAAMVGRLQGVLLVAGHFLWFVDHAKSTAPSGARLAPPSRLNQGIRLEHVSFRYPGTERDILQDVNLFLPAGTVVAFVGENGAGKSTLIKLLCGFYPPTQGRIAVDGVDLADLDVEQWRDGLSGAFQDFCKFEFIAAETVGVGDLSGIDDPVRIGAAAQQTGASGVIDALPDGLATQLGRTFQGVDLSQGQWQKLALARSRMLARPLLYLLDEPTASLDAGSEYELFSQINRSARQAAAQGAITLLVSHRLSTVRDADLIVVLHHGQVVEVGSHVDLMNIPRLYAELFTLQSRAYQ